jgi:hypothetical protein
MPFSRSPTGSQAQYYRSLELKKKKQKLMINYMAMYLGTEG